MHIYLMEEKSYKTAPLPQNKIQTSKYVLLEHRFTIIIYHVLYLILGMLKFGGRVKIYPYKNDQYMILTVPEFHLSFI